MFSFHALYVRAGPYLSLIIKEVEEEMERLWMLIHLSFFWDTGNQCPQPHSVPALGQAPPSILLFPNLPSSTDLLQGQSCFLEEAGLRIYTPIQAPPGLKKGFCFVFMLSQEKAELDRSRLV